MNNKIKQTSGEKAFNIFNICVLSLFALTTLLPFMHVFSKAVSGEVYITLGRILFWPIEFQLNTLWNVLNKVEFKNAFFISVFVTFLGSFLAILITVLSAYPLSKPKLRGRKFFMMMFVFIMLFSGGMIPNYMLFKVLNILNTRWALIFPGMLSVFNLLLIKTFMEELPESIEESARIDGASNMTVLFQIVLPMSLPVLATVTLFYAVGYWNNYMSAVLYITRPELKPLQQYLYDVVTASMTATDPAVLQAQNIDALMNMTPDGIRAATVMLSTLPILFLYPFLQKYFVKGITIGSVKG